MDLGSLKIVMNVFDDERLGEDAAGDRLTGVKKVIVLAYVPDVQESHYNLGILYNALRLNDIKCYLSCDFKVLNIMVGLSAHGGVHSCLYCDGTIKEAGMLFI